MVISWGTQAPKGVTSESRVGPSAPQAFAHQPRAARQPVVRGRARLRAQLQVHLLEHGHQFGLQGGSNGSSLVSGGQQRHGKGRRSAVLMCEASAPQQDP